MWTTPSTRSRSWDLLRMGLTCQWSAEADYVERLAADDVRLQQEAPAAEEEEEEDPDDEEEERRTTTTTRSRRTRRRSSTSSAPVGGAGAGDEEETDRTTTHSPWPKIYVDGGWRDGVSGLVSYTPLAPFLAGG